MGEGGHNTEDLPHTPSGICKNDEEDDDGGITRIFVGGLGATVTAEDLRNTFSCLGKLHSVELVRTNGRSFAYFDFFPSSPKSLTKLFSTYNGCMWKGGRLRLEKAKEHYLLRLRREWAENANFANSATSNAPTKDMGGSEMVNNAVNQEKMEVRIFFPKLKKVKSLPFSGTGKHKYSFQRVEVRSLPIHFCDCEEHSYPSHTAKGKDFSGLETQVGGIDEKEINMMDSVMNKLFERESISKAACSRAGLVKEADNVTKSVDENETDDMTDEDNLVINMVAAGKNRTALSGSTSRGQERNMANERAVVDELRTSKERASRNMLEGQRKTVVPSDKKKRKSLLPEETDGNEIVSAKHERKEVGSSKEAHLHESAQAIISESGIRHAEETNRSWSQKSSWTELAGERGNNNSFSISHIIKQSTAPINNEESKSDGVNVPHSTQHQKQNFVENINWENQTEPPSCFKESKEEEDAAVTQPNKLNVAASSVYARGASWLQKSSWTQLVASDTNNSFSISQILPEMDLEKHEVAAGVPKSMGATNATVTVSKYFNKSVRSGGNITTSPEDGCSKEASGVGKGDILCAPDSSNAFDPPGQSPPQKNLPNLVGETTDEVAVGKKNHAAAAEQPSVRNSTIMGETCTFMRSAASMKEWMNAKTSLSGSLKKKKNSDK